MKALLGALASGVVALAASEVSADERVANFAESPPWIEPGDLPLPFDARSVRVNPSKEPASPQMGPALFVQPGSGARRGTVAFDSVLPLFGAKRGPDCLGRWLLVGPLAWICGDGVSFSAEMPLPRNDDVKLGYRYYFVGSDGAEGFESPESAEEATPLEEYEPGFGIAVAEERRVGRSIYVRTPAGKWIDRSRVAPARISSFHGEEITGEIKIAWAASSVASYGKPKLTLKKREVLSIVGNERDGKTELVRVKRADGTTLLLREKDLVRPTLESPPSGIGKSERWIDVDRKKQTLVAYQGESPIFATLVSTGKGAEGSETSTPKGVFRIWVKLASSNMDNLEEEDVAQHYSLADVPYVQFFQKGIALHGAFWHDDFGTPRSHGCVNLSLADAERLFRFTGPHLPAGWSASLPTELEPGTLVRVR